MSGFEVGDHVSLAEDVAGGGALYAERGMLGRVTAILDGEPVVAVEQRFIPGPDGFPVPVGGMELRVPAAKLTAAPLPWARCPVWSPLPDNYRCVRTSGHEGDHSFHARDYEGPA